MKSRKFGVSLEKRPTKGHRAISALGFETDGQDLIRGGGRRPATELRGIAVVTISGGLVLAGVARPAATVHRSRSPRHRGERSHR